MRTGDLYIRKKLHVKIDHPGPIADRTAQFPCIVGKIPCFITKFLSVSSTGECLAQLVVDIGVGGYGRADIDTDRCRIDQFHMCNSVCADGAHMIRQRFSVDRSLQTGNQTLQDERRLAGTGHAGNYCQLSFRDIHFQRLNGMDG